MFDQVQILAEGIPDIDTGVDTSGLMPLVYKIIGIAIFLAVVGVIIRSLPKWLLIIIGAVAALAVTGYFASK